MSYFDDELERGRGERAGSNLPPRRPVSGQNQAGTGRPAGAAPRRPADGRNPAGAMGRNPANTPGQNGAAGQRRISGNRPQPTGAGRSQTQPGGRPTTSRAGTGPMTPGSQAPGTGKRPVAPGSQISGTSRQIPSGGQGLRSGSRPAAGQTQGTGQRPRFSGDPSVMRDSQRISGSGRVSAAGGSSRGGIGQRDAAGTRITATNQSAQKAKMSAKSRRVRRLIILAVAECITLAFIFTYAFFARKWSLIVQSSDWNEKDVTNPVFSVDMPEYMKGHWTFAVFGVDSRDKNVLKGTNSDVIMICDVNQDTGEIKLVSVFRDSYLNIDDKGTYNKINQAYFVGGPTQAVKALNKNLDLNITDYVTFNWNAVADGINALGGIDMNISKAEFYFINSFITETVKGTGIGSTQLTHAGDNHLDGVQAVAYGRLRLMDTDFARTERQRKVIKAAFGKAIKADWQTLNSMVGAVLPQVSTCIDVNDIFGMLRNVTKYHIGDTMGFPAARGDANLPQKGACVIPQTLESNVIALHQFLFGEENYTPSSTVKEISAKIASDTGMYKEGIAVNHVSTDNGVIPSSKATTGSREDGEERESSRRETYETDEEGNLYDEEGNLVDEEGRLIDEYGFLIDEHGRRIDEEGNLLNTPRETDVFGNEVIDGETIGGGNRPGNNNRPAATVSPVEPTRPSRPSNPGDTTSPTSPTSPTTSSPGGIQIRPGGPGSIEPTEGTGPGTGLEPGGSNENNPGGPGIIDNSGNGPSSGGNSGPGGSQTPGGGPGPGGSTSPAEPGPSGGPSSITPVPTENYDNVGPGM